MEPYEAILERKLRLINRMIPNEIEFILNSKISIELIRFIYSFAYMELVNLQKNIAKLVSDSIRTCIYQKELVDNTIPQLTFRTSIMTIYEITEIYSHKYCCIKCGNFIYYPEMRKSRELYSSSTCNCNDHDFNIIEYDLEREISWWPHSRFIGLKNNGTYKQYESNPCEENPIEFYTYGKVIDDELHKLRKKHSIILFKLGRKK